MFQATPNPSLTNLESQAARRELEELKREVQEQETESQAVRRELEGKTEVEVREEEEHSPPPVLHTNDR